MDVLVSLIRVIRPEIGRARNLQRNITLGVTYNCLRSRQVLTRMMVLFAAFCLGGCIVAHSQQARQTIELEVINEFGSRENALNQPWVLMSVVGESRPMVLTANQKAALMDAIKNCYGWGWKSSDDEKGGGCAAPGLYRLCVGPGYGRYDYYGPEFSLYLDKEGFLIGYMCATPDDIVNVHYTIKAIFCGDPFVDDEPVEVLPIPSPGMQ